MFKFENPLDPSKDGQNAFIDGIRYHIRDSEELKEQIKDYILKYQDSFLRSYWSRPLDCLEWAMKNLGIDDSELIISDEHELLDWIALNILD